MNRPQILEAVEALRQRKCRPEREAIAHYILKKYGTQFQEVFSDLETIVDHGDLIKVEYKGSTSYRQPKVFDTKASPLLTKHSKILNSNRTIRFILTSVTELLTENETYTREGIPPEEIKKKLISYDSVRFTPITVETFLQREIAIGALIEGPQQRLFPKDLPLPEGIGKIIPPKKMRGRKPAVKSAESTPTSAPSSSSAVTPETTNTTEVFAVKSAPIPATKPVRAYGRKSAIEKAAEATAAKKSLINSEETSKNGDKTPTTNMPEETSTGRSVRNKRKKEVFDPSDLPKKRPTVTSTTPITTKVEKEKPVPVAKRTVTPPPKASKKNLKQKKDEAEKGVPATLCEHCQRYKNIKGHVELFIVCSVCADAYHPSCLEFTEDRAALLISKAAWQCKECKVCQFCTKGCFKGPETILCSTCDMGFHYKCLKLKKTPAKERWDCPGCKIEEKEEEREEVREKTPEVTLELVKQDDDDQPIEPHIEKPIEPDVKVTQVSETMEIDIKKPPPPPPASGGRRLPMTKKRILQMYLDTKEAESEEKLKTEDMETQPLVLSNSSDTTITASIRSETVTPVKKDEEKKEEKDEEDDIPSDASKWTPSQVEAYFKKHGLREEGALFREQEIDGLSLLLMRRQDIVNGMKLLLGPALKVFKLVVKLQQSGGKVEEIKSIM